MECSQGNLGSRPTISNTTPSPTAAQIDSAMTTFQPNFITEWALLV